MDKNKFKKIDSSVSIVLIIGILVLVNFFSYKIFHRFDLTQNKDYSISPVTKEILNNLDDIVIIKAYFSKNLPSQFISLKQDVSDILDEYINYSKGKIKVEFINPDDNEEIKKDLYLKGIPELQFNVFEKDKAQVVRGYMGMLIQYGDNTEVIPVIKDTKNLEYDITVAIKKVINNEDVTIGILGDKQSINLSKAAKSSYDNVSKIYNINTINLEEVDEIPDNLNTFIIAGPKEEFSDDDLKKIDNFFMKGKSLLVLLDGVINEEGLTAKENKTNLDKLLESYGVKLNHNLVLDVISGKAPFSQGFITFITEYPFWPKVTSNGFDKNNPIVSQLESVIFPWVSSIDILTDKIDKDNYISYLAKSSDKSWIQKDNFNLNPQQRFISGDQQKRTLAVLIKGKFNSYYSDKQTNSARLAVVGDSDFIKEGIIGEPNDNSVFFQNLIDGLSMDASLISIRAKGITNRPIKELSYTQKMLVRYSNIFGLTVIVILFGLLRYYLRRRSKFIDEL